MIELTMRACGPLMQISKKPIDGKSRVFGWRTTIVDFHNIKNLYNVLSSTK